MNKTITGLALLASASSAFAMIGPGVHRYKACIDLYLGDSGDNYAGTCDQTDNNKKLGKKLNSKTGCPVDQAQIVTFGEATPKCMPVGAVQL